jgi:hypothetical membrane protein
MTTTDLQKTSNLLKAGIIAGPFFIVVALIHAFLREGFDPVHHPASLLSLGKGGWIQNANFVLTGLLYIALSAGLRRILKSGTGSRWISPLFLIVGISLIAGGVFVPDPSLGFPPGTPAGVTKEMSWHSIIHGFAPAIAFTSLVIALIITGRRFGSQGNTGLMWLTIIVSILTFVLSVMPNITADWQAGQFNFIPLWAAVILGFGYTSFIISVLHKKELGSLRGNEIN